MMTEHTVYRPEIPERRRRDARRRRQARRLLLLADGVHFTLAGQERLAEHVLAAIEKDWRPSEPPP